MIKYEIIIRPPKDFGHQSIYLRNLIELKRLEMLNLAEKLGMNHIETINCSQLLDQLIILQMSSEFL